MNLDTKAYIPTQTFDVDARVSDVVKHLKRFQPGEYRFFDGDHEMMEDLGSPIYVACPGHEAIGFRYTSLAKMTVSVQVVMIAIVPCNSLRLLFLRSTR
jgi:hypothetical protein